MPVEADSAEKLMNEEILDEGDMLPRGHARSKKSQVTQSYKNSTHQQPKMLLPLSWSE